jgi:choline dehydrogenase-like flavoprotein
LSGQESKPNLTILTNTRVNKLNVQDDRVTGVDIVLQSGAKMTLHAKAETIVCAGAVDSPRLFLLSGIGPREQLESLKIPVVRDIRGVGENLIDHPESIIIWELNQPTPKETVVDSDAAIFLRRKFVTHLTMMKLLRTLCVIAIRSPLISTLLAWVMILQPMLSA